MRQVFINVACGAAIGGVMAAIGYPLTTAPFWIVFGIFVVGLINNLIEP